MNEEEYFAKANSSKPVYNVSRNEKGKTVMQPINKGKEEKTINQINNDIQNKAIDQREETIATMLEESYNQLSRIQVEIEILKKMYDLYNKEIYLKQIKTYQDNLENTINRIRVLKTL